MTLTRRQMAQFSVIGLALLVALYWSYDYLDTNRAAAADAGNELLLVQQSELRIKALGRRSTRNGSEEMKRAELNRLVEKAATDAGLSPSNIGSVTPVQERKLGDSVYKEKPVGILLQQVTLQQSIRFLHNLVSSNPGIVVRELMLSTPPAGAAGNQWNLQATVSYLIYAPNSGTNYTAGRSEE